MISQSQGEPKGRLAIEKIRSMLLLNDNSVTLSSVSSAALSKCASDYIKTEDNEE